MATQGGRPVSRDARYQTARLIYYLSPFAAAVANSHARSITFASIYLLCFYFPAKQSFFLLWIPPRELRFNCWPLCLGGYLSHGSVIIYGPLLRDEWACGCAPHLGMRDLQLPFFAQRAVITQLRTVQVDYFGFGLRSESWKTLLLRCALRSWSNLQKKLFWKLKTNQINFFTKILSFFLVILFTTALFPIN